jgi:hypothetical protein
MMTTVSGQNARTLEVHDDLRCTFRPGETVEAYFERKHEEGWDIYIPLFVDGARTKYDSLMVPVDEFPWKEKSVKQELDELTDALLDRVVKRELAAPFRIGGMYRNGEGTLTRIAGLYTGTWSAGEKTLVKVEAEVGKAWSLYACPFDLATGKWLGAKEPHHLDLVPGEIKTSMHDDRLEELSPRTIYNLLGRTVELPIAQIDPSAVRDAFHKPAAKAQPTPFDSFGPGWNVEYTEAKAAPIIKGVDGQPYILVWGR